MICHCILLASVKGTGMQSRGCSFAFFFIRHCVKPITLWLWNSGETLQGCNYQQMTIIEALGGEHQHTSTNICSSEVPIYFAQV